MQREKEGRFHLKSTANCLLREGFHHNVENKRWTWCPKGATHNEVLCRVMNKSQLFCEWGSGMWQESIIRPKSESCPVPGPYLA